MGVLACDLGHTSARPRRLRTLGTLNESLPDDRIPPLAGSIDEIDALNLPSVLICPAENFTRASVVIRAARQKGAPMKTLLAILMAFSICGMNAASAQQPAQRPRAEAPPATP